MNPTTLAHLSDLHFGRLHDEAAEVLLADLHAADPDLIIVSGDLTQTASPQEFQEARAYLDKFPKPPLVVPGNHDLPTWNLYQRFTRPTHRFRRYIDAQKFPFQEAPQVAVLGINSTRPYSLHWDWSRGRISFRQLKHIRQTFADYPPDSLKVVVTHHPFLLPPKGAKRHLVQGPGDVMKELASSGVDLLLAGHLHKAYSGVCATRHPQAQGIVVAQTSTSTSHRLRAEPNSYNWFRYDQGRLQVTIRSWVDGKFVPTDEKFYHKTPGHWERDDASLPEPAAATQPA